ncbi:hypothetical protein [Candidatus Ichthyocystis hellenicum]|uniref:hypothetical protein n=1 Tax=Candidatus Ichthyocystis hellenicum TaxID=1561003 RepID=UPI000B81D712|nr:hypothetical protein [Candidatus Ichthyocystis hellenicum]
MNVDLFSDHSYARRDVLDGSEVGGHLEEVSSLEEVSQFEVLDYLGRNAPLNDSIPLGFVQFGELCIQSEIDVDINNMIRIYISRLSCTIKGILSEFESGHKLIETNNVNAVASRLLKSVSNNFLSQFMDEMRDLFIGIFVWDGSIFRIIDEVEVGSFMRCLRLSISMQQDQIVLGELSSMMSKIKIS